MTTSSRYLASYLVAIYKIQRIAYRKMSKTQMCIYFVCWQYRYCQLVLNLYQTSLKKHKMIESWSWKMLSGYWTIEYNYWTKLLIKVCEFFLSLVLSATEKQYVRYIVQCWRKLDFPDKNRWPAGNHWQIVLGNVVSTAQSHVLWNHS